MSTGVRVGYDEFEAMIARGEFDPSDPTRYELIEGEILPMVAPNPPHDEAIDVLARWSIENVPRDLVRVRVNGSVGLRPVDSLPLPDLSWLRERSYARKRPAPEDVFLIIEVSHTSLSKDRGQKGRMYARAGIADNWIVNLRGECIEIYREPGPKGYKSRTLAFPGEVIHPRAFPDLAFPVSLIFPEEETAEEEIGP